MFTGTRESTQIPLSIPAGLLASALVQAGEPERGRAVARYSIFNKLYQHAGRYGWVYVFQGLAEAEAEGAKARVLGWKQQLQRGKT